MLPTLKEGDMVFFKKYIKNKSLLKVGQIVIFHHPLKNIRLIKRVKNIIKNSVEVLGDNNKSVSYTHLTLPTTPYV